MNLLAVLGTAVAVLIAAIVLVVWWHVRARRRWHEKDAANQAVVGQHISALVSGHNHQLRANGAEHANELAALEAAHAGTEEQLRQRHAHEMASARGSYQTQIAELQAAHEATQTRLLGLREAYVKAIGAGDLVSRNLIAHACTALDLDAVLLTNIRFRPKDATDDNPFHAQIDHLLITTNRMLPIENKYWKGVTLHDARLLTAHPVLARLLGDTDIAKARSQSISMVPVDGAIKIQKRASPAEQVRRQAGRLHDYLGAKGIELPWIDTCVFYSHSDSYVLHHRNDEKTAIISNSADLESNLRTGHQKKNPSKTVVPVNEVIEALAPYGPDIVGFGRFATRWKSPL